MKQSIVLSSMLLVVQSSLASPVVAEKPVDINDLTIIWPQLDSTAPLKRASLQVELDSPKLLRFSDQGKNGSLFSNPDFTALTSAVLQTLADPASYAGTLFASDTKEEVQGFQNYSNWRVIAFRLDPCFRGTQPSDSTDFLNDPLCQPEIRLVAQPLINYSIKVDTDPDVDEEWTKEFSPTNKGIQFGDMGIHLIYAVPKSQIVALINSLIALRDQYGSTSGFALGAAQTLPKEISEWYPYPGDTDPYSREYVGPDSSLPAFGHPTLFRQGNNGPFAQKLKNIILQYCATNTLKEATVLFGSRGQELWKFARGLPRGDSLETSAKLPYLSVPVAESVDTDFSAETSFTAPDNIVAAKAGWDFQTNSDSFLPVLGKLAKISNATINNRATTDCVSCHTSTQFFAPATTTSTTDKIERAKKDLISSIAGGRAADTYYGYYLQPLDVDAEYLTINLHALGYFDRRLSYSIGLFSDADRVVSIVNAWMGKKSGSPSGKVNSPD